MGLNHKENHTKKYDFHTFYLFFLKELGVMPVTRLK